MTGVPFAGFLMFALDAAAYAAVTQTLKENGAHETPIGLHKKDSARLRALSIGKNAARLPWKAHNRTRQFPRRRWGRPTSSEVLRGAPFSQGESN